MKKKNTFCLCLVVAVSLCCLFCGCGAKETAESGAFDQTDSSVQEFDRIELTRENIFDYIDYAFTYDLCIDKESGSTWMRVYNVKITTWSPFSDYEFYNVTITFFNGVHIPGYEIQRIVHINKTGNGLYNSMETYYDTSSRSVTVPKNRSDIQVAEGAYVLIPRSL